MPSGGGGGGGGAAKPPKGALDQTSICEFNC